MFQVAVRNPDGEVGWDSLINEKGNRYGRWRVFDFARIASFGHAFWWCECTCGAIKAISGSDLRRRQSESCGCRTIETTRERVKSFRDKVTGRILNSKKKEGDTR